MGGWKQGGQCGQEFPPICGCTVTAGHHHSPIDTTHRIHTSTTLCHKSPQCHFLKLVIAASHNHNPRQGLTRSSATKELDEQASALRERAKKLQAKIKKMEEVPYTNGQWLTWLEKNAEQFQHLLATASADRRSASVRLQGTTKDYVEAPRLLPRGPLPKPELPGWIRRLLYAPAGFFRGRGKWVGRSRGFGVLCCDLSRRCLGVRVAACWLSTVRRFQSSSLSL